EMFRVRRAADPELAAAKRARKPWEAPVGEITARITAEYTCSEGYEPDHDAYIRFSRVGRRLRDVESVGRIYVIALGLYYGDVGNRFAREDGGKYGRMACLYPLVASGKKLIERTHKKRGKSAKLELSSEQAMMAELKVQDVQPQPGRKALLDRAQVESAALYKRAVEAWNGAAK